MSIKSIRKATVVHSVSILLLSAILDALWFRRGLTIAYSEPGLFTYNNIQWIHMSSHLWVDQISTGTPSLAMGTAGLPLHTFLGLLEFLGFSPVLKEAIFFYLILSLSGLSMYYLMLVAFRRNLHKHSVALLASIFYILNPYVMVYIWNMLMITMNIAYAIIPLVLALYMKGLAAKKFAYAFYAAFVLLVFSSWIVVVPALVPFLLLTYLIFHVIVNPKRREVTYAMKFSALLVILYVALNLWLLLPLTYNLFGGWWGFSIPNYAKYFLPGHPLQDVIKLNFYFTSNAVIWPFYKSIPGEILGAVIPIVVFGALIAGRLVTFKKKKKGVVVTLTLIRENDRTSYFAFLAILGVFLGSVATTPLRDVIATVLDTLPLSAVISNTIFGEKTIQLSAVGYSALFGLTLSSIHFRIIKLPKPVNVRVRRIIATVLVGSILFATCVVYVWPMWTGDVFTHPLLPTEEKLGYIEVPRYYYDAATWLSCQKGEFRILSLPFVAGGISYTWKPYGYSGATTDFFMLPKPVIMESQSQMSNDLIQAIPQFMDIGQVNDIWKALSLLNVKYIMVHEDINYTHRHTENPKDIEHQLTSALTPYLNVQNITNSEGNPITSSLEGWQTIWGTGHNQISMVDPIDESPFVEYRGFTSADLGYFALAYVAEDTLNLSNATWLDISLLSTLSGKMFVSISDTSGNEMFFDGRSSTFYTFRPEETGRWVNFTLPLGSPSHTTAQKPNLSSVHHIIIGVIDIPKNISATLMVRNIMLDEGAEVPIEGISFERRFGELAFYKVDSNLERIYVADYPIIVSNSFEVINKVKSQHYVKSNEVFIESNVYETTITKNVDNEVMSTPKITFEKIDPTKWVVHIQNATNPFFLVFNEAYNPQWRAYCGDIKWPSSLFTEAISEKHHFMANAYANAWYINKTGTYTITLYFWPQSILYLGVTISSITLTISVVFILRKPLETLLSKLEKNRAPIRSNAQD